MRSSANVELRKPIADRWENGNGGDDKDDNKQHYNPLAMWPCFKGSPNFQENKLLLGFQLTHQPSLVFTIIKLQNTMQTSEQIKHHNTIPTNTVDYIPEFPIKPVIETLKIQSFKSWLNLSLLFYNW